VLAYDNKDSYLTWIVLLYTKMCTYM